MQLCFDGLFDVLKKKCHSDPAYVLTGGDSSTFIVYVLKTVEAVLVSKSKSHFTDGVNFALVGSTLNNFLLFFPLQTLRRELLWMMFILIEFS